MQSSCITRCVWIEVPVDLRCLFFNKTKVHICLIPDRVCVLLLQALAADRVVAAAASKAVAMTKALKAATSSLDMKRLG